MSTAVPTSPAQARAAALRVTCWGTRGSVPSPGPATARFGGNTSCVEVRAADDRLYVLDAGTGIRALGRRLADGPRAVQAELFLTHFHWDHIQGIPFFAPLYDPEARVRVHAPRQGEADIRSLFASQMSPTYFPVPFEALSATLEFRDLDGRPWGDGAVEVRSLRLRHPGWTHGYRIEAGGAALAYVPDNEISGDAYDVGDGWYGRLVELVAGCGLLIHDAMYTDAELPGRRGWGHSTPAEAVRLAADAGVRRLLLFHHAPDRTDAELDRVLEDARSAAARAGVDVGLAAEGEEHPLQEPDR